MKRCNKGAWDTESAHFMMLVDIKEFKADLESGNYSKD